MTRTTSKLFVANGTRQDMVFYFRAPNRKVMSLKLGAGRQEVLDYGWTMDELAPIAAHLELYGAREANEADRLDTLARLIYQFDKPIKTSAIDAAREHNTAELVAISAEEAERSGVAFYRAAHDRTQGQLRSSEIEIIEEGDPKAPPRKDAVNYSLAVDPRVRGRQEGKRRSNRA